MIRRMMMVGEITVWVGRQVMTRRIVMTESRQVVFELDARMIQRNLGRHRCHCRNWRGKRI
jgi:hypothetical protein